MVCLCEYTGACGVRILECRSLDSLAVLPDEISGLPVVELAPYLFSVHGAHDGSTAGTGGTFLWAETESEPGAGTAPEPEVGAVLMTGARTAQGSEAGTAPASEVRTYLTPANAQPPAYAAWQELPVLCGDRLEELRLPAHLEKVGAYALYNCGKLKKLELYSTTLDWGAGVFTGCYGVEQVVIHVDENRKSCMREVLAELRQTLEIVYLTDSEKNGSAERTADSAWPDAVLSAAGGTAGRDWRGDAPSARLIFPEFFEEAVENTPARILVTETHGCGHKYRNAFVRTQFQFKEYDSLFPHIQVQEPERLVARLALGRLMDPYRLEEPYRERYREYLIGHAAAAAGWAVESGDMPALEWIFAHIPCDGDVIAELLDIAGACGNGAAVSFLMDRRRAAGAVKRRRFSL